MKISRTTLHCDKCKKEIQYNEKYYNVTERYGPQKTEENLNYIPFTFCDRIAKSIHDPNIDLYQECYNKGGIPVSGL